jgi:hypothetical protein
MKFSTITSLAATAICITTASAFIPPASIASTKLHATTPIELVAEPEGGAELNPVSDSLPGSRMKDMGAVEGSDGVHSFWLSAVADGKKIKELRAQTEKEASKKANFPGFRKVSGSKLGWFMLSRPTIFGYKNNDLLEFLLELIQGQIPPYAMPKMTVFAIQEAVIKTCK